MSMGVDAYQTYQTSRTTFSAAVSAAPVTILARDTALSLAQLSTKYPSRCRPKKNQIIPTGWGIKTYSLYFSIHSKLKQDIQTIPTRVDHSFLRRSEPLTLFVATFGPDHSPET